MNTNWFGKYIGLPFVDGGRDFKGVDCWGLVRLVFKNELDVDIPSYGDISAVELSKVAREIAQESVREPWLPVIGPIQVFDVAVMHKRRAPIHVGIMTGPNQLLHIEKSTSAVHVPIIHPTIKFRSAAMFRHRDLL